MHYLLACSQFLIVTFFTITTNSLFATEFVHPSDVAREMQTRFKKLKSYSAKFEITLENEKKTTSSRGKVYYSKEYGLNFEFTQPYGDRIVSDKNKMWIYVAKLNAVGIQNFSKGSTNQIMKAQTYEGLVNLFRRYHYRFETGSQPRSINGFKVYVLALKEKVSSGGYESLTVYVTADNYLIHKIEGQAGTKRATLTFSSIEIDPVLPKKHFKFKITDTMKVVENPITIN